MLHQPVTTYCGEEDFQHEPKLAKQIAHDLDHSHARLSGYWKDGNLEVSLGGGPRWSTSQRSAVLLALVRCRV